MKPTKKTYGEAQKKHAVNLRLISRFSYAEIETETGIPEAYVRKLVHEENAKEVTLSVTGNGIEVTDAPNAVTQSVTAVTDAKTPEKKAENADEMQKTQVTGVTNKQRFFGNFTRMDAVAYATIVTACIGVFELIGWWFVLPCVPYTLIFVDAMQAAKRPDMSRVAERGRAVVIVLELIAAVSNHSLFNRIFWQHIEALPVEIIRHGNLVIKGADAPFYAAASLAFALFCAAFYAIDTAILRAKIQAEQ